MSATALPAELGRYRPQAVLGAGAMGVVYRAHDPLIDRAVAIKVMRTEALDDAGREEFLQRFRREAQAAARCNHPAIVAIYDFKDDPAEPFIVMELVEGRSLSALLRDPAARATPGLPALLLPVLEGLGAAHALGIVHRDVKPANIVITADGRAKVMDFGIARMDMVGITAVGGMLGTPSTMAPEQARGETVDHRADLFAVGAILYDMLLGRPPFAGASLPETFARLLGPEPAALGAQEATPLGAVLRRALAKDPAQRFGSAAEFGAALRAALTGGSQPAEEATVVMGAPPPATTYLGPTPVAAPRFDPSLLARLAEDMAASLGPIATTLVRRAAERAGTMDELLRSLAERIEAPEARAAFLRRHRVEPTFGSTQGTPVSGTQSGTLGSGNGSLRGALPFATMAVPGMVATMAPPVAAGPFTLPPPAQEACRQALAFHAGPIAGVLVKRAMAAAESLDGLLDLLATHVPKAEDKAVFRKRLRAEIEARGRG